MLAAPYKIIHKQDNNVYYVLQGFDEAYLGIETLFRYQEKGIGVKMINKVMIQGVELLRTPSPLVMTFAEFLETKEITHDEELDETTYEKLNLEKLYKTIEEQYEIIDKERINSVNKYFDSILEKAENSEQLEKMEESRKLEVKRIEDAPSKNKYDWVNSFENPVVNALIDDGYSFVFREKLASRSSNIYLIKDNGMGILTIMLVYMLTSENTNKVISLKQYVINKEIIDSYMNEIIKGGIKL